MTALGRLQEHFQNYLLTGSSAINHSVVSTKAVSAEKRLSIYHDAYHFRLIECLATNFPALYSYLGTEEFESLSRSYIQQYPSHNRSIRWYGHLFADFIKKYYKTNYIFLAELTDFEWKMTLAFDAEDASIVTIEEMAAVSPELWADLRFSVHPSVQRAHYFWNVIPLWQALVDNLQIPTMSEGVVKSWIVWRNSDLNIQFYSLSLEEAWMLNGIIQGLSFAELCQGLCKWIETEKVAMSAASFLKGWIQKGILSELHIN